MSHIIVIFDCSGSMAEPFHALKKAKKQNLANSETKIEAAKKSLLTWLLKSEFDVVTIIPFSSKLREKLIQGSLTRNLTKIRNYIFKQYADGNTNLELALSSAFKIAKGDLENSYIQFLIVTDGLSQTVDNDIKLVHEIPLTQSISGILIDPTLEGEAHLSQLCVRGTYLSVTGIQELATTLEKQEQFYSERIKLSKSIKQLSNKQKTIAEKFTRSENKIKELPPIYQKKLEQVLFDFEKENNQLVENEQAINEKIADKNVDSAQISNELHNIEEKQAELEAMIDLLQNYDELLRQLRISVSYPRYFAKGHISNIRIVIYPIEKKIKELNRKIRGLGKTNRFFNRVLVSGLTAVVKIKSNEIDFSGEIAKKFIPGENDFEFTGNPYQYSQKNLCEVVLTISNQKTGLEYENKHFQINLVDYAFGTVSRPLLLIFLACLFGLIFLISLFCVVFQVGNFVFEFLLISVVSAISALIAYIFYTRNYKDYTVVQSFESFFIQEE